MEHIPDNAKILVIEEYKIWIPNTDWSNEIFLEQAQNDRNARKAYDKKIATTYFEIKNGKYKGFSLPEEWNTNEGREQIYWGSKESLLRSWLFPKKKKWNEDGTWNW